MLRGQAEEEVGAGDVLRESPSAPGAESPSARLGTERWKTPSAWRHLRRGSGRHLAGSSGWGVSPVPEPEPKEPRGAVESGLRVPESQSPKLT